MPLPLRKDVPEKLTWDLSAIYKDEAALTADTEKLEALSLCFEAQYQGKLNKPETIAACLEDYQEIFRLAGLTSRYCGLATSVDFTDTHAQELEGKVGRLVAQVFSRLSFLQGELSALDEETLRQAMELSTGGRGYLKDILRSKPYLLHPETEKALAALSQTFQTPYQVYNMSKMGDMIFPSFTVDGKEYPLGYSLYEDDYEYEENTAVRHVAFAAFSKKLRGYENITATAYNAQVQQEKTLADLRGFPSVFDSLLFEQKVTPELYHRQIDLIMEKLAPHMQKYARLLRKIHKLDKMTYCDLKLAIDPEFDPKVTIDESREMIKNGLSVLGEDYIAMVEEAYKNRWIDFAQNQGKSTGGFCDSPYGTHSYILLSWNGRMSDVFTLAHELGHAGHFKACNTAQSVLDVDVSMYFVECPSTTNELIMANYLLKTSDDPRFRRWVLSSMIGHTYYHNFVTHLLEAAYQREVYRIVDGGGSVNAPTLSRLMKETLQKFWGDAVEISDDAALTWMRQPHYYMGLYPYTYSAGLTIGTQVCKRIEQEGQPAVDDWKKVLSAGSTLNPVELAALAKIDITTDGPLLDTIAYIGSIIDEIEALTNQLEQ